MISKQESVQHNIILAKKYLVDSIYRSANIEGINATFPETQAILDNAPVENKSQDIINSILDLKRAWEWVFDNIESPINVDTMKTINRIAGKYTIAHAGVIRDIFSDEIHVSTEFGIYYPPLPEDEYIINSRLNSILTDQSEKNAIDLFCYIAKSQLFSDGNKRTATILCNLYMIQNGLGIMSIPPECKADFYKYLGDFYYNDNKENLYNFLKNNCILKNDERTFAEKLAFLRERNSLERIFVAQNTHIDPERLFELERGIKKPTINEISTLNSFYKQFLQKEERQSPIVEKRER